MSLFDKSSNSPSAPPAYTPNAALRSFQAPPQNPTTYTSGTVLEQINSRGQFRSTFASLSLHMTDRIRMLQFPPSTIEAVHKAINANWPRGLQANGKYANSHQFQLYGRPWGYSEDPEARRLVKGILEALYNEGWILYTSTDCSKKERDKDTLIFRKQDPIPERCEWMSVAFTKHDHLMFIDAPRELVSSLMADLKWHVQSHGGAAPRGCYDVKLNGYPWVATGEETMRTRLLLLKLIEGLESHGFTVYASVDQYSRKEGRDADVWHCCRRVGWTPGAPVYHA